MDFKFVLEAVWLFLPMSVANQCPGLVNKFNLPYNYPVSERWLGTNKTWAAYYGAAIGSMAVVYLQGWFPGVNQYIGLFDYQRQDSWLIGVVVGLGAVAGDHLKSFFKRWLGIEPGKPWRPFDQIDYVIGSVLFSIPLIGWIGWPRLTVIIIMALLIHLPGNYLGKRLGLRKVIW
ncbi:MAG: CDP-archaeol synthase [Candidatus Falkowbacteria bacterium]